VLAFALGGRRGRQTGRTAWSAPFLLERFLFTRLGDRRQEDETAPKFLLAWWPLVDPLDVTLFDYKFGNIHNFAASDRFTAVYYGL
jgi:hypothetical protein